MGSILASGTAAFTAEHNDLAIVRANGPLPHSAPPLHGHFKNGKMIRLFHRSDLSISSVCRVAKASGPVFNSASRRLKLISKPNAISRHASVKSAIDRFKEAMGELIQTARRRRLDRAKRSVINAGFPNYLVSPQIAKLLITLSG
jgi:hypothetical protein